MKLIAVRDDERVVPRECTEEMYAATLACIQNTDLRKVPRVSTKLTRPRDHLAAKKMAIRYAAALAAAPPPRTVEITEEEIARAICQSGYEITAPDNMPYWINFLMEARAVLALIEGRVKP